MGLGAWGAGGWGLGLRACGLGCELRVKGIGYRVLWAGPHGFEAATGDLEPSGNGVEYHALG